MMAEVLEKRGVIGTRNLESLVKHTACNTENKSCMYSSCDKCSKKEIPMKIEDPDSEVKWPEWIASKEERQIKGESKQIQLTIKAIQTGTVAALCRKLNENMFSC
ncbi:hypothetical protein DPMN_011525 [Dreissena polymorpha]|uniref:Uncharacterized protein n=1 Tax=Dreissena polymorpha TaxID=45954 RepID=A0A9D4N0R1_DREPO|nr:hypothetical protein DPMN_011525 [Dreissena polymorpha]